jgi:hypothetical protein
MSILLGEFWQKPLQTVGWALHTNAKISCLNSVGSAHITSKSFVDNGAKSKLDKFL